MSDTPATPDAKVTPPVGADTTVLRAFIDAKINYNSVTRNRRASTWTKAARYREAHQWCVPSFSLGSGQTPHWTDLKFGPNDDDAIPTPTQPEIFVHLSNEQARLGKPEFEPYVRPDSESPDILDRTGAKLAERALQFSLAEMDWEEIEAEGDLHMPLFGQTLYKSYWQTDATKSTRVPVTTAKACPRHPMAMGNNAATVEAEPQVDPDPTPAQAESGSTQDTDTAGKSQADLMEANEPPAEEQVETPHAEAAEAQTCDFVTCKPELELKHAATLPPETLASKSTQGPKGTDVQYSLDVCPQCEDHPPLVDFFPSNEEAVNGKDAFGRPLGKNEPLGEWKLEACTPDRFFPASMGVGIKARHWPWWLDVYPLHVSDIAKYWENGKLVKPENAQAIMQWHPIGGERSVYESGGSGDAGVFDGFCRVKEYHEKPSVAFPHGRSIIIAGNVVLLDGTYMVPSQQVPGEFFERTELELIPWEIRPYDSFGLSMFELLESLQDDINEVRSMEADIRQRMGIPFFIARRGMDLDTVALESGGYAGKVVEYGTDPLAPNAEIKAVEGKEMSEMVPLVEFFINRMGAISGSAEPETGPPAGSPWSSLALQFQAEKSGERRANRIRRKRKALERLYSHGLKLMYHRCLEPRTLRFEDGDGEFKQRSWKGIELNGQIRVTIDAESEHDTAFQKQQKLTDAIGNGLYDMQNPAVRNKLLQKLELPRDVDGTMETQEANASREWCDFRDLDKEPIVDESIDDPMVHHECHGKDIQGEEFHDLEEQAQWDTIYPYLCDWKTMWPVLQQTVQASGVMRPPLLEYQISAAWDTLLVMRQIDTRAIPKEQLDALRKVMRFRAHYEAHTFAAELAAQAAAMGQAPLAKPGAEETAGGTMPAPGQPAQPQAPVPAGVM